MTLSQKRRHFTKLLSRLLAYAQVKEMEVALDTARRSPEEQKRLVEIGASQTLRSKHVEGLAVDLLLYKGLVYIKDSEAYRPLGSFWVSLDPKNVWGGNWESFPDGGHFEYAG